MIPATGRRLSEPALSYAAAFLMAGAAQAARLLLHSPTAIPFITYAPFVLASGAIGGLGPGLVATILCCLEALLFALAPLGTLTGKPPDQWVGLGALAVTGMVGSSLFELLIRARRSALKAAEARTDLAGEVDRHRTLLDCMIRYSPAAMALLDGPDCTIRMLNPAFQALAPGESMDGRPIAQVWPEAPTGILPLLHAVRDSGVTYQTTGYATDLHRGPGTAPERRYFDVSLVPVPAFGPAGNVAVLAAFLEVTQHKQAQLALERAYAELAAIYDYAPVMLLVVDEQLTVVKANQLVGPLGKRPGEALGCLNSLDSPHGCGHGPHCADCSVRRAILDSLQRGILHADVEGSLPVLVDGQPQPRTLLVSTAPLQFEGGGKVLVCAQDMTRLKSSQRQLEAALAEKTVLLQEVHHRVKNNLAVISSLLTMKADSSDNPEVKTALEQSGQRVHSMALIHELLYGNEHLDRVDFSEYARQLVRGFESERIAIETDLAPIELTIERAVPCGLILNELLSNAFKYAFPGGRPGTIRVLFRESAPGRLQLTVEDDGVGLEPGRLAARSTKSLGMRIVSILTRQIDGALEQGRPPGTRLTLTFPL